MKSELFIIPWLQTQPGKNKFSYFANKAVQEALDDKHRPALPGYLFSEEGDTVDEIITTAESVLRQLLELYRTRYDGIEPKHIIMVVPTDYYSDILKFFFTHYESEWFIREHEESGDIDFVIIDRKIIGEISSNVLIGILISN